MPIYSANTKNSTWRRWVYGIIGDSVIQTPTSTTTLLEDNTADINTSGSKVEGAMVFNATTNLPVWAAGDGDSDVWVNATGATAHTPV